MCFLLARSKSMALACALTASIPVVAQAPGDVRLALVIGNSAYATSPLKNPSNDATSMATALQKLGFTVSLIQDGTREQLLLELTKLHEKVRGQQAVAAIYFAGHGLQAGYDNFIVPVDASIRQESDIAKDAINISQAVEGLSAAGGRLNLLILDACRDNPFRVGKEFVGLAPKDAPRGTFLAYATEAGNVALDGDGNSSNGLYTAALINELVKPAATIDEVLKRVRFAVWRASNGTQIPGYSNGSDEVFGFESGFKQIRPSAEDRAAQFLKEKNHWDRIRRSTSADEFFDFIDANPESAIGELAQATLERLSRRKIIAQAAKGEAPQNPADSRFRKGDSYKMQVSVDGAMQPPNEIKVVSVDLERAQYSGVFGPGQLGESTLSGAVVNDGVSSFDPPYVLVPGGEYQVGKRWYGRTLRTYRVAFNGAKSGETQWMDYSARVVTREKITVPAGTFDTYRIEFDFLMENGITTKATLWAQPDWGIGIKTIYQYQDPQGARRTATRVMLERMRG